MRGAAQLLTSTMQLVRASAPDRGMRGQCAFLEHYDADGDGNVDLDEFRAMIHTAREVGVDFHLHAIRL